MSSLVVYKIKRKQKKSRRQFTWTTERIWMDVILSRILNEKQILGTLKTIEV